MSKLKAMGRSMCCLLDTQPAELWLPSSTFAISQIWTYVSNTINT